MGGGPYAARVQRVNVSQSQDVHFWRNNAFFLRLFAGAAQGERLVSQQFSGLRAVKSGAKLSRQLPIEVGRSHHRSVGWWGFTCWDQQPAPAYAGGE
jgi:serine/threonine protein kinase HipA of HipAB toxin-antitoxin module